MVQRCVLYVKCHRLQPIVDRVGAGDAFAGGVLHGILAAYDPQTCIDFATAAGALKHTVHGDCNQFSQRSPCFWQRAQENK